jgi:hypothetical protein
MFLLASLTGAGCASGRTTTAPASGSSTPPTTEAVPTSRAAAGAFPPPRIGNEPSTTEPRIPVATESPTSSPYYQEAQALLGTWQLRTITGPGTVDPANFEDGYMLLDMLAGRPSVSLIHGFHGCGEVAGSISLRADKIQIDEQYALGALPCTTKVPALADLSRALTTVGVDYVVSGDRLALTLPDRTGLTFNRHSP